MAVVTVADNTGTISIDDGNSVIYIEKKKVDVTAQGGKVTIRWDENTAVTYTASQFIAPSGTAAAIAAAIAVFLDTGASSGVTGSGTLNYIPKWTPSGTALGNSLLYDNGTSMLMGGTTAIASAQFAMTSTTQGFLVPRMTTAQKNLIGTPATALLVYDTTLSAFSHYNGAAWAPVVASGITVGTTTITSGTSGAIPFNGAGVYQEDATQLFWDNTNNRLGVGTNAPAYKFHVYESTTDLNNCTQNPNASGYVVISGKSDGSTIDIITTGTTSGISASGYPVNSGTLRGTGDNLQILASNVSGFINFKTGGSSSADEKMRITSDGCVAIGVAATTGYNTKLYVKGANDAEGYANMALVNSSLSPLLFVRNNGGVGVGIDNTGFSTRFFVKGSGATSATYAMKVQNSASTDLFNVRDDGYISAGLSSTALTIGLGSGFVTTLANTVFGVNALSTISTGQYNIAVGSYALNHSNNSHNTAVGSDALYTLTSGAQNTSVGRQSSNFLLSGGGNTVMGYQALYTNSIGGTNTAIGQYAGYYSTGSGNVFLGQQAGQQQTTESNQLFIDNQNRTNSATEKISALIYGVFAAAVANQTLRFNASVGINTAPLASTTASILGFGTTSATYAMKVQNSASTDLFNVRDDGLILAGLPTTTRMLSIGQGNGFSTTNNVNSVFVGIGIAPNLTSGIDNTFVGANIASLMTTSSQCTGIGTAIYNSAILTGNENTAVGQAILNACTSGFYNVAVGTGIMSNLTTGQRNTVVGSQAATSTTGDYNTVVGHQALKTNAGNSNNTAIGANALYSNNSLGSNTAIGAYAGYSSSGYRGVFLGHSAGYYSTQNDALYIHNSLGVTNEATGKTNSLIYGIFNATVTSQELHFNSGIVDINGRLNQKQGTDAASASTLTLTYTGNVFELTGTTAVDLITSTGWQDGSVITLVANESVTINHATATSGANITILLSGAANFSMTANDTLTLVLCSTTAGGQAWRELARTAI